VLGVCGGVVLSSGIGHVVVVQSGSGGIVQSLSGVRVVQLMRSGYVLNGRGVGLHSLSGGDVLECRSERLRVLRPRYVRSPDGNVCVSVVLDRILCCRIGVDV